MKTFLTSNDIFNNESRINYLYGEKHISGKDFEFLLLNGISVIEKIIHNKGIINFTELTSGEHSSSVVRNNIFYNESGEACIIWPNGFTIEI